MRHRLVAQRWDVRRSEWPPRERSLSDRLGWHGGGDRAIAARPHPSNRIGAGLLVGVVALVLSGNAATAHAVQVPVDEPGSPQQDHTQGQAAVCKSVTITGHVFYNDLREDAYRDKTAISIATLREGLVKIWSQATADEKKEIQNATSFGPRNSATVPLDLCRFLPQLTTSTLSLESLSETLGVNGIDCGLP
jgi:hypothetical protein